MAVIDPAVGARRAQSTKIASARWSMRQSEHVIANIKKTTSKSGRVAVIVND